MGILVGYILGLGFPINEEKLKNSDDTLWKFIYIFPIFTSILRLIFFFLKYKLDTPYYYIQHG